MENFALKPGEVDSYNALKLQRLIKKHKFKELTFRSYSILSEYSISDSDIMKAFGISRTSFWFFKSNHLKVLGGKKQCH